MRLFTLLLLFSMMETFAAPDTTLVYLFPGQGSDERLFSKISLDSNFKIVHITYPVPAKGTTMKEFAHIISAQVDTTRKYVFVGVSLGGMLCTELADFMKPEQVIIISSAKCRKE